MNAKKLILPTFKKLIEFLRGEIRENKDKINKITIGGNLTCKQVYSVDFLIVKEFELSEETLLLDEKNQKIYDLEIIYN